MRRIVIPLATDGEAAAATIAKVASIIAGTASAGSDRTVAGATIATTGSVALAGNAYAAINLPAVLIIAITGTVEGDASPQGFSQEIMVSAGGSFLAGTANGTNGKPWIDTNPGAGTWTPVAKASPNWTPVTPSAGTWTRA